MGRSSHLRTACGHIHARRNISGRSNRNSTISRELGVTAVELMPLADFPGNETGAMTAFCPTRPTARYGRPEDLKRLIQAAHRKGLMVFLDVVYNHFGPEGNYLRCTRRSFLPSATNTRGVTRSTSTGLTAVSFAISSFTMPCTGWRNTTSTVFASMRFTPSSTTRRPTS